MTRNTRQQIDDLQRRLDAAHAENVRLKSVNDELRRTNMVWIKRYREALGKYREADTGLDALRSDLGRLASWFNAHPQMRSGTGTVDDALAHLESHVSECLPIIGVTHETGETIANRQLALTQAK